jgi:hypothetical protein
VISDTRKPLAGRSSEAPRARPRVRPRAAGPWLVAAPVLLLAGCPPGEDPKSRDGRADVVNEDAEPGEAPVCLRGEPFVADGPAQVRDAEPGDAARPGALRWQRYEGCERLVLDLQDADGGAAGRAGRVGAEVLRGRGVVRVELRDVPRGNPDATDAAFDGPLARAAFVVASPDGRWHYLDLHLARPAEAFVTTLDDPARVVVDLRPGGPAIPDPAPRSNQVVVLEPRPGPASYPLTVTGYARTFEANVVVRLEQDGEAAHEEFTTSTGYVDAWGHYSFTIADGPRGRVTLHVGDYSARDGTWEGAAVDLELR